MSDLRLRQWNGRTFVDPAPVLRGMRQVEVELAQSDTPSLIRRLRTGRLKDTREARNAALFAYGLTQVGGNIVYVSPGETEDADFLMFVEMGAEQLVTPVQLKELVPEDLNPAATLDALLGKLSARPQSDTVLAVLLNRRGSIGLTDLTKYSVPFSELWFYWSATPDQSTWGMLGDAMREPRLYSFQYPT